MLLILYSWNLRNYNSFVSILKLLNIPCTQLLVNHHLLFLGFHRIRATLLKYLLNDLNRVFHKEKKWFMTWNFPQPIFDIIYVKLFSHSIKCRAWWWCWVSDFSKDFLKGTDNLLVSFTKVMIPDNLDPTFLVEKSKIPKPLDRNE